MKVKIIILLALLSSINGLCQNRYEFKGIVLRDVVSDTSSTADQLYHRAKLFFANNYKDSKDVITFDDSSSKVIIGRGYVDVEPWWGVTYCRIYHTVKIECKDGRYRYDIYDKSVDVCVPLSGVEHVYKTIYEDYINNFKYSIGRKKITIDKLLNPMLDLVSKLKIEMKGNFESW